MSSDRPQRGGMGAVYGDLVEQQIADTPRDSTWRPEHPLDLTITAHHMPRSRADLSPAEKAQLVPLLGDALDDMLGGDECEVEAAQVVDAEGKLRFRLYGWNYGGGYLFAADTTEVVGCATQHDLEHWRLSQRPIFWAMDAALRKPGHGFQQPLSFCWWDQNCWDELEGTTDGDVGSEPNVRAAFERSASDRGSVK